MPITAAFYFDLASPLAYMAAERVLHVLPDPAEWRPVLARELAGAETLSAWRSGERLELMRSQVDRRARELDLQPIRWPEPFPFDSALAMRVATYAASIGRAVPFAQAAFRQAFAAGHSLEDRDFVLIAAAACEMHPMAVLRGAELASVSRQLADTTAKAARAGVTDVPAIVVGDDVFLGEDAPERAAAHMRGEPRGESAADPSAAGPSAADPSAAGPLHGRTDGQASGRAAQAR